MALTDENGGIGATMLVSPTNGNGGFGNGFGGDWAWIIRLLLRGWAEPAASAAVLVATILGLQMDSRT